MERSLTDLTQVSGDTCENSEIWQKLSTDAPVACFFLKGVHAPPYKYPGNSNVANLGKILDRAEVLILITSYVNCLSCPDLSLL